MPLGPGLCVVDEGGSIVPVAKATVKELRAEAEARQIVGAKDMKRPELAAAIKVCVVCVCLCVLCVFVCVDMCVLVGRVGGRGCLRCGQCAPVFVLKQPHECCCVSTANKNTLPTAATSILVDCKSTAVPCAVPCRAALCCAPQAARARLPFNVLQAQVSTAGEGIRGEFVCVRGRG